MAEVEIGIGKSGRRAYGFDDIAIVPSRRTRDPDDIDISWDLDAYHFELPLLASAMDGVVSPRIAVELGRLGGLGVLNLEGLWTRYEDPDPVYAEIASLPDAEATKRMQEIYTEPIKPELIGRRVSEIKDAGVVAAASLTPQRVARYHSFALEQAVDEPLGVVPGHVVVDRRLEGRLVHPGLAVLEDVLQVLAEEAPAEEVVLLAVGAGDDHPEEAALL